MPNLRAQFTKSRSKPSFPLRNSLFIILPSTFLLVFSSCSSPPPIPQWEYTGGPTSQNLSTVLVDPHHAATVYAGTSSGEFFVSSNRGDTWEQRSVIAAQRTIHTIISHPEDAARMFAGTDDGLSVSRTNGAQWTRVNFSGEEPISVRSLAIDPFNPDVMYAGVDAKGIFISSDGGSTWNFSITRIPTEKLGSTKMHAITIDASRPNMVYALMSGIGIAISTDAGKSWNISADQLAASGTVPLHLALHRQKPGVICFGAASGDVFKSTDGGTRWSPTRQGNSQTKIGGLVADASDPEILYAGTENGVLVSNDFGSSWKNAATEQPRVPTSIVVSTEMPRMLYAFGEGVGFKRTTNAGLTWIKVDIGLGGSTVSHLSSDRSGRRVYAVTGEAMHYFSTGTTPWISCSNGLHGGGIVNAAFDVDSASTIYAGTTTGVYKSVNGGNSWTALPRTFGPHALKFFDTHSTINTRMFAQTEAGFFYSTDRGSSWSLTKPIGTSHEIQSIAYTYNNAGILHAALGDKAVIGSTDGGISWISRRYGIKTENILAITHSDASSKIIYAWSASGEGFRSMNQAIEWDRYAAPWTQGDRVLLWVDKYHSNHIVALVNERVIHHSDNGGGTWKQVQTEVLKEDVLCIFWSAKESALYAGTRQHGVFRVRVGNVFASPVEQ